MRASIVLLVISMAAGLARADDARAQWNADAENLHAGVPFELDLVVIGFDEQPQPTQPQLTVAGATARPLGASPSVSQSITIINGKYTKTSSVKWVLRWSVTPAKAGALHVPALTVSQSSKRATAAAVEGEIQDIATTDAMKLELALPSRPVFVGENIPVTLTWLFRASPQQNPTFQVPMLDGEAFTIGTVPATNQKTYKFSGGDKTLDLPYTIDEADLGGVTYHRLRATFYAAPKKTGKIDVAPAAVIVALPVGRSDFFGNAPSRMFRAVDVAHALDVKPLPETDRPLGFAGAVGTQFSMQVSTSRSVVQLGEPVELSITVKSDQRLDTLSLGRLDGPGGLPKDRFTVPQDPPTGELSDDGKAKTFKVTANVTGPATEVPSLAFSYFDPVKGAYQTVHSDPIALAVKGGTVVGASDVVAAAAPKKAGEPQTSDGDLALVGADLALSTPADTDDRPLAGGALWLLVGLLYAIPLVIFGVRGWQLRTRGQREEAAEVRAARRVVERELARAAKDPARDTAGALSAALRGLARALERDGDDGGLLARIETEGFAPAAASSPLSPEVRAAIEAVVRKWTTTSRRKLPKATAIATVLALVAASHTARAADARTDYQHALAEQNASARRAQLQSVEQAFALDARARSDRPELLADWGTAALAAGDVATATLAFRRALAIDGSNARARKNLAWLRGRQPEGLRPAADSAADTLFFFHQWPRARRLVVGAIAFALAVLLVVPWTGRRRRALTGIAIMPLAIWIAMTASALLEDRHAGDAVVMNATVLRAADSSGAPAAMAQPIPRGAEITVLEQRDTWTRVRLANGNAGWVEAGTVERISP
jgi:hypothetical protein